MSHHAFLEIRRRRGFTLASRNFVLLRTGRSRIQIRTGWTLSLLLRISSVPQGKCWDGASRTVNTKIMQLLAMYVYEM